MTLKRKKSFKKCKIILTKFDYSIVEKICTDFNAAIEFCNNYQNYFLIISEDEITSMPSAPVKYELL
jgi:hypothetical protein